MSTAAELAPVPEMAIRTLACAVIKQALTDALDPTAPADVRRDAEHFLAGDLWFRRWCAAADLPTTRLLSRRYSA